MASVRRNSQKRFSKQRKLSRKKSIQRKRDVLYIMKALEFQEEESMETRHQTPKQKAKKSPSPQRKKGFVQLCPSLHSRLQYIDRYAEGPDEIKEKKKTYDRIGYVESANDLDPNFTGRMPKKLVHIDEDKDCECSVILDKPLRTVVHTDSYKSIFSVASPILSGINITPQRTLVAPYTAHRPPLPPLSADEMVVPQSGIVINWEADYDPDMGTGLAQPRLAEGIVKQQSRYPRKCRKKCKCKTCRKAKSLCPRGRNCRLKKCKLCRRQRRKELRQKRKQAQLQGRKRGPLKIQGMKRRKSLKASGRRRRRQRYVTNDADVCGRDDILRPEHPRVPRGLKKGIFKTHSYTIIPCSKKQFTSFDYGIVKGSCNMYDSKFGANSRGKQALAMSVMAYCLAFHYHPKEWNCTLIDSLLDAGDVLHLQCLERKHDHSAYMGICEVLPFGKKQVVTLNRKRMQVMLCEPEIVGYALTKDPAVYNLCKGLKAFFTDNRAGVMMSRFLKVCIWKDKICYYLFDPAGRNSKGMSDFTNGKAALINVKNLKSVAELLLSRSIVENQKFILAPIKVLKMIDGKIDDDLVSEPEPTLAEKAAMGYKILNENSAIVSATMHLGHQGFGIAKYRQALPMAIMAMTYAKISPPNTWHTKTLDKILRLGNKLYKDCHHNAVLIDLTVDNIPNEIAMYPYTCEIIIYRERVEGQIFSTKECILDINRGLEEFFEHGYSSGIIDFSNYILAIWKQKDMYYLFDPYPRTPSGMRTLSAGKSCCFMLLNIETLGRIMRQNWEYLPGTTKYCIHAFKVLKLKKKKKKNEIICSLSDSRLPGSRVKRSNISEASTDRMKTGADVRTAVRSLSVTSASTVKPDGHRWTLPDEEQMGDITSLVDSINEDVAPNFPLMFRRMETAYRMPRIANLDSPTVSLTQVLPPWPKPRDKTDEVPDEDPTPEPTPPPTPPPPPQPEGAEEENEEELDEEAILLKKEEEAMKKALEEEERRKAEELPEEMPQPPPTPVPDPDLEPCLDPQKPRENHWSVIENVEHLEPIAVDKQILLAQNAKYRTKLRKLRNLNAKPLVDRSPKDSVENELAKPNNFIVLFNKVGIVRGRVGQYLFADQDQFRDFVPFTAIMAIVISYKYSISTWSKRIIDLTVETAIKVNAKKKTKFQLSPAHIIPKIRIGTQAFRVNIDVAGEGPTWLLSHILKRMYLTKFDRGIITTATYSSAFFVKNGLYYLYEGRACDPMGYRLGPQSDGSKGAPCLLRFRTLEELCERINLNKNTRTDDQHFILSRIKVRKLLVEPRYKLTEDHDFGTAMPKSVKSKAKVVETIPTPMAPPENPIEKIPKGYQPAGGGVYRIKGTTLLTGKGMSAEVKPCHFVGLIAMLMVTMHPLNTWNYIMVDLCLEKGLEIAEKANNFEVCDRRIIRNILLDKMFINVTIKKIIVVNDNPEPRLSQFLKAVLRKLRYVMIRFPEISVVIVRADGFYHLFDPYAPPPNEVLRSDNKVNPPNTNKENIAASWTLYRTVDEIVQRLIASGVSYLLDPDFYSFELTSVKKAPHHAALNYRLSPLFKPDVAPNARYIKRKRKHPIVDEKRYWLDIDYIPWSPANLHNDLGLPRNRPDTLWRAWNIEFPGDLYSVWGTTHPTDSKFPENNRGKQYLCTCVVALALSRVCGLEAYTAAVLDGIVEHGSLYHSVCCDKLTAPNHELQIEDLATEYTGLHPYKFKLKFKLCVFGFLYNIHPDRFNLSKALVYFFETNRIGILMCPTKNLAFGRSKDGDYYFMFDCQSFGRPLFDPGRGVAYMLRCESLNRLIYCLTITLNIQVHGSQFHLYSVHGEIKGT